MQAVKKLQRVKGKHSQSGQARAALLNQTEQELSIPIVPDLEYREVHRVNHAPDERPILPGYRAYPPKMGMFYFYSDVFNYMYTCSRLI